MAALPAHATRPPDLDMDTGSEVPMVDSPSSHTHAAPTPMRADEPSGTVARGTALAAAVAASAAATSFDATSLVTPAPNTPTTHAHTQGSTAPATDVNGTAASPLLVAQQRREVASSAVAAVAAATKSPASHGNGLLESPRILAHPPISPGFHPMPPHGLDGLLSAPRHASSSHSQADSSNFLQLRPSSSRHLADSAPVAVAPTEASSSHRPNAATAHASRTIHTSSAAPHPPSCEYSLDQDQSLIGEQKQQHEATGRLSPEAYFAQRFSAIQLQLAATTPAPSSTAASPSSAITIDTVCHCLMVVESRLGATDSPDRLKFAEARALAHDGRALLFHLSSWVAAESKGAIKAVDMCSAYVTTHSSTTRIHLNFTSLAALHRAVSSCHFLVRCGALDSQTSAWGGASSKPCGPQRHMCPEALMFSFVPTRPLTAAESTLKVRERIEEMKVDLSTYWISSQHVRGPSKGDGMSRVLFYALPRDATQLGPIIDRLHNQFEIQGGKIRVHAPNSPNHCRCNQCGQLGHTTGKCSLYEGLAVRLPMQHPTSHLGITQLIEATGARAGFLGSGFDELKPSRRVTLLFAADSSDQSQLDSIIGRLATVISSAHLELFASPHVKNLRERKSECSECGHKDRAHACRFQHAWLKSSVATAARLADPAASPDQPAAPAKNMCRSWFMSKTCPRKDKGQRCKYDHPVDHSPPDDTCFEFAEHGHCSREQCRYKHERRTAVASPADAVDVARAVPDPAAQTSATQPATPPDADRVEAVAAIATSPAASDAAPAAPPTPAASPQRMRKRPAASMQPQPQQRLDDDPLSAAQSSTPPRTPKKRQAPASAPASAIKPPKPRALAGFPTHTTRWGDMQADDDDEPMQQAATRAAPTRAKLGRAPSSSAAAITSAPTSSLSTMFGTGTNSLAPTRTSSASASTKAARK